MRRLIQQRGRFDCGVACIAMLLGVTYEEASAALGRDPNSTPQAFLDVIGDGFPAVGVLAEEVIRICFERQLPAIHVYADRAYEPASPWLYQALRERRDDWLPLFPSHAWCWQQVARGATAMLSVDSLNIPDAGHWVVVSDGKVFDPTLMPLRYEDVPGAACINSAILLAEAA